MRIGVPKEIKEHEYRVGLTPESVREFAAAGHELSVETGAGAGINATDRAYMAAGATIVDTAAEIFATSEMIVKVKEPQESEWTKLRENQIVFAFLHLAADLAQTKGLLASGCTAVAYETVTGPDGQGLCPVRRADCHPRRAGGRYARRSRPRRKPSQSGSRRQSSRCSCSGLSRLSGT
jgi:alanine dehydrogenase